MSIFNMLPSLGISVLLGYIFVPVFFPSAWWVLILMTIFFFWTKMTETIVATPGNLPSIYQCYYKAFSCCRSKKLDDDEKVPKISADAANVIFSYSNIQYFDTFTDKMIQRESLHPALRDVVDASIDALENPTTKDAQGNIVPAPPQLKLVAAVNASSERDMPAAFYLVPTFNMELSVMVFSYFPLSVWSAQLVKSDMTVFFHVNRGVAFTFSTRIASSAIRGDAVEVVLVTEILTDMENLDGQVVENPETGLAEERSKLEEKTKTDENATSDKQEEQKDKPTAPPTKRSARSRRPRPVTRVVVATVVNTYSFAGAAPRASTVLQAATDYFTKDQVVSSTPHVKASYALYPEDTVAFANSSGNVHPRHLAPSTAKWLGEKGSAVDPMLLQSTFLRLLSDLNPRGSGARRIDAENELAVDLGLPYRAVMEVKRQAKAPAMVNLELGQCVDAPELEHRSYVAPAEGVEPCMDAYPQFKKAMFGNITTSGSSEVLATIAVLFDKKK